MGVPNPAQFNFLQRAGSEVVPDSEEERQEIASKIAGKVREVIVISSDSESEEDGDEDAGCTSITMSPTKPSVALPPVATPKPGKRTYNAFRRIIQSSDEESEVELIEATTDNVTESTFAVKNRLKGKEVASDSDNDHTGPNYFHNADSPQPAQDDAILVLDEPTSARKPVRINLKKNVSEASRNSRSSSKEGDVSSSSPSMTPTPGPSVAPTSTPASRRPAAKKAPSTPGAKSKKAEKAEKQKQLYSYAQDLFSELNETVFKGGLPADTKLNWNNRLTRTAGRAKFHRSREGTRTVEIELAEKILDCEERIRNTLSHEMCHLATWVIDGKIDEHHGPLFKQWSVTVMKKHPHIHVSVRHDYDISHPYEWKCEDCGKIYGRFSKSIRPDKCLCGACKKGKLIPLFATRQSKSTPKLSKFAASKPQDSPRAVPKAPAATTITDSDDSDIEILTQTLATTSLAQ